MRKVISGFFFCSNTKKNYCFAIISLLTLLSVIYANSIDGTWVFDDLSNILENKILSDFSWSTFVSEYIIQHFIRPLVFLSFLLNYQIGGYDILGYHIFNFIIHFISSIFVFLFIYKTLNLPLLKEKYGQQSYPIALLASFFWATSPLHVTAVTYIVQRMASMAGMFYFMGMYFYAQARTAKSLASARIYYIFCAFVAVLGILSKENAAMLPVSLYLYDLILIRGIDKKNIINDLKKLAIPAVVFLLIGAIYLLTTSFPLDYRNYTFSLKERLLTEPRIILFYISLLIYPLPGRLMLDHDYTLSTSLFTPWTTIAAICVITVLIVTALVISKKKPLIAFCIIFFFLNHVIESSIIPIEIIYEYRNYIPSISFFILIAIFMVGVLNFFQGNKVIYLLVAGCIIFLLAAQGDTVYRRNQKFVSEKIVWIDNSKKTPYLSRPHSNLAIAYLYEGNKKEALIEAKKAVDLMKHQNYLVEAIALTNLGILEDNVNKNQETAAIYFQRAINLQPNYSQVYGAMAHLLVKKGDLNAAKKNIIKSLSLNPNLSRNHSMYALIMLHQNKTKEALHEAHHAWNLNYTNTEAKMVIAEIMRRQNYNDRSIMLWESCLRDDPDNQRAVLALIELYDRTRQYEKAIVKLNLLVAMNNGNLKQLLSQKNYYDQAYWINEEKLKPVIRRLMAKMNQYLQ